ncbi:unnamed protein product [Polarella glacialis]|uniref:Reverse transcriptase Ty1/copia-type domain-containing protein n=1 Tax=Polarella glacialis TaxID=89957 RepID=A0A813GTY4_POLGL|nr:unnamed protein product [Polarella glacialis]
MVFGKSPVLPGSLLELDAEDDFGIHSQAYQNADSLVGRAMTIRTNARMAVIRAENSTRARKALVSKSRPTRGPFDPGETVFVWRRAARRRKHQTVAHWAGPGTVVVQEGQTAVWVDIAGQLIKAPPEAIRRASSDEKLGADLVNEAMQRNHLDISEKQQQKYQDTRHEVRRDSVRYPQGAPRPGWNASRSTWTRVDFKVDQYQIPKGNGPSLDLRLRRVTVDLVNGDVIADDWFDPALRTALVQRKFADASTRDVITTFFMPDEAPVKLDVPHPPPDVVPRVRMERDELTADAPPAKVLRREGVDVDVKGDHSAMETASAEPGASQGTLVDEAVKVVLPQILLEQNVSQENVVVGVEVESAELPVSVEEEPEKEAFLVGEAYLVDEVFDDDEILDAWIAKGRNEIRYNQLSKNEQRLYDIAILDEWKSILVDNNAVIVIEPNEAARIRRAMPERVIRSRLVLTRKMLEDVPEGGENWKAKARWCVLGFEDPDATEVGRASPTVAVGTLYLHLQLAACMRWKIKLADVKTAFLNSAPQTRELYAEAPSGDKLPIPSGSLIKLIKPLYGQVDAPLQWHRELQRFLTEGCGMKQSRLDPCKYMLFVNGRLHGSIVTYVDDLCMAGDEVMNDVYEKLQKRFKFGKWQDLKGRYCGREIVQNPVTFEIKITQHDDIMKLPSIPLSRGTDRALKCDAENIKLLRSLVGALSWFATQSRIDIAGDVAFLQSSFPEPTWENVAEGNRLLKLAQDNEVMLKFSSIEPESLTFLLAADAGWANAEAFRSQAGWIIGAVHEDIVKNITSMWNPIAWKSHKLKRVTNSTLASETMALAEGLAEMEWLMAHWLEFKHHDLNLRDCVDGTALKPGMIILRDDAEMKSCVCVTDCKSVYDVLSKEGSPSDKRTAIELLIIKESLVRGHHHLRWVDTRVMLADPLTKRKHDGMFLRDSIKRGTYILVEESKGMETKLADRAGKVRKKKKVAERATELVHFVTKSVSSGVSAFHCATDRLRR